MNRAIVSFVAACTTTSVVIAATECVNLDAATVCSTANACYNTSDCTVDCGSISVNVVGRCGNVGGTADITVADTVTTSATTTNNYHCWCALTYPFATKWVYRYAYANADQCAYNCGRGCRNGLIFDNPDDVTYRTVMYSNRLD